MKIFILRLIGNVSMNISNWYPQHMFSWRNEKTSPLSSFLIWSYHCVLRICCFVCYWSTVNVLKFRTPFFFFFQRKCWLSELLLSSRVLDSIQRGCGFKPHRGHCVVSLSKTHWSLLRTGSTQEDPSQHNWKTVNLDVNNQTKQKSWN